jgi:dTMP kinase
LEFSIFGIPKPDMTIFLNVSPETSIELVKLKEKRDYIKNDKNVDLHEADKDHIINAYNTILQVVDKFDNCIKIDCEKDGKILPIDVITKMILEKIL